jgi:transposase-like protein
MFLLRPVHPHYSAFHISAENIIFFPGCWALFVWDPGTPVVTQMPPTISHDFKARVPVLFFEQDKSVSQICTLLGVKKTFVYTCLDNHTTYGVAHNPHWLRSGCPQTLTAVDIKYIKALLEQTHTMYLDEL